jgi:hypothetical protein
LQVILIVLSTAKLYSLDMIDMGSSHQLARGATSTAQWLNLQPECSGNLPSLTLVEAIALSIIKRNNLFLRLENSTTVCVTITWLVEQLWTS